MKKILIPILALSMLAIVSCKKKDAAVNGGSWAFKSKTYTVTSGITNTADNAFVVVSKGSNEYNQLLFTFYNMPSTDGSYTVVAGAPDSTDTQVGLSMHLTTGSTYAGPYYSPDPSNTGVATVTVTNGIMKLVLPTVDMVNDADATDHSPLTGTVNQTQK